MKRKIIDLLGYCMFLAFFIIVSPFLMVYGAFMVLPRYYWYVSNTVKNKPIKRYKF